MRTEPFPVLTGDARTDRALCNLARLLHEIARNPGPQPQEHRPTSGATVIALAGDEPWCPGADGTSNNDSGNGND